MIKQFIAAVAALMASSSVFAAVCLPFSVPVDGRDIQPIEAEWHYVDRNMSVTRSGTGTIEGVSVSGPHNVPRGFSATLVGGAAVGTGDATLRVTAETPDGTCAVWLLEQVINPETGKAENVWHIDPEVKVTYDHGMPMGENPTIDVAVSDSSGAVGLSFLSDEAGLYIFINSTEFLQRWK